MLRLVPAMAVALWMTAMVTASSSSTSVEVSDNSNGNWVDPTVDVGVDDPTSVFQPADDFVPESKGSAAKETRPSDGNGGGLSSAAAGVIVTVSVAGVALAVGMVVYAWRAAWRREEEGMFMDLGDERNYAYGRFGDYAAM